jgi:hypothetical protein
VVVFSDALQPGQKYIIYATPAMFFVLFGNIHSIKSEIYTNIVHGMNFFWKQQDKTEVNVFTLTVLLIGIFGGLIAIFYFGAITFIRVDSIFNIAFLAGAVIFIIHLPFMKRLNRFLAEIIAYSFLGWGLIITGLFLSLNFVFHNDPETDHYPITYNSYTNSNNDTTGYEIQLVKSAPGNYYVDPAKYDDYPYLLKFEGEREMRFQGKPSEAMITTAKGLFGYRVILAKELR